MKKICLSLIAVFMVSSIGFANTIEKNELEFVKKIQLITNEMPNEDFVTMCYLMSQTTIEPVPGLSETTNTYWCVNHPEIGGNETIYIGK